MATLKQLSKNPELLSGGHRACAGCSCAVALRQIMLAAGKDTVISFATGCMEVVTTIYPYSAWRVPYIHNAFENSFSTMSGVEASYQSLKRLGRLPVDKKLNFIAFAGDGGTYDIGFQALSGAAERGHDILHVCYNNEAYMNTGIQRSSATPLGASTTTTPAGKVVPGKKQHKKDLVGIMAAHNIPYVAQTTPAHWKDLNTKVEKALSITGPKFMNVYCSCHRGWRIKEDQSLEILRLAVDCCVAPLFEVEDGEWKLNYKPKEKKPVSEWLKLQGRFKHLSRPEFQPVAEELQAQVDKDWEALLKKCGEA